MQAMKISKEEARNFLIRAHMMDGPKLPPGEKSIMKILNHLKAVQVDPINIAGTNQDIALNSRIRDYTPEMLDSVLYEHREAYEHWLKCLCILPASGKPYYEAAMRKYIDGWREFQDSHKELVNLILKRIEIEGPLAPQDFEDSRRTTGGWHNDQRLVARILQSMFDSGILMIHHRKGRMRYYDLADRCIPWEKSNPRSLEDYKRQAMLDLYSAMRLFSSTVSIDYFVKGFRKEVQSKLLDEGSIIRLEIEDAEREYFILSEDKKMLSKRGEIQNNVRFIAPLDSILWDRKLVAEIFDFNFKVEIYTPPSQRKFGYYCLPILYGNRLVGRIDLARDKKEKSMKIISIFLESSFEPSDEFLEAFTLELKDYKRFLGMMKINPGQSRFARRNDLKKLLFGKE